MINQLLASASPLAVSNSFSPDQEHMWRNAGTGGGVTSAGVHVSDARALQLPVVLDCLKVLSETVATLPLHMYERTGENTRARAPNHPLTSVLSQQPNAEHTAFEFFQWMMWELAWNRNAYAEIVPGPRGFADQLIPLKHVRCERLASGQVVYTHYENGKERVLLAHEVWHLRAAPLDDGALCGKSVMATSREVIGRGIAVHQYGSTFFNNNGMSGGVISGSSFKTPDDRDRWLEAWRVARTGRNAHKDALLMPGMEYTPHAVSNEAAQFNETEKQVDSQLARIWRMPPHKVGIMDKATFTNIEQQSIEFVVDTVMPWLVMIEQAISRDLILAPRRYFAQFNVNGLLRGDTKSRFEAYSQAIQAGWLSPNDVRRLENLDPIPGGGIYFRNAALVPLDSPANPPPLTQQAQLDAAQKLLALTKKEVDDNDEKE